MPSSQRGANILSSRMSDVGCHSRVRQHWAVIVLLACAFGSATCRPPASTPAQPARESTQSSERPRPFTRDALEIQPEMLALQQHVPPGSGFHPATTSWATVAGALPAERAATPGALLAKVAAARGWTDALGDAVWEETSRLFIENDERATAVLLLWNFLDDAVAGHDFRLSMALAQGEWRVERVDQRYHCRRSVTAAGQCG